MVLAQKELDKLVKVSAPRSQTRSKEISCVIPGGVNSPFRTFREVGGHTLFFERGEGSRIFDIDGNSYIDYVGAWGPAILGHGAEAVTKACQEVIARGPLFGAPHELELELAKRVVDLIPSISKIRFVNSGTEAVMSSIRLARAYTGKDTIIMLEGCYHGHSDSTLGTADHMHSAGIPKELARKTLTARYNDLDALDTLLDKHPGDIAAVILEPVAGSMGVVPPEEGYLNGVRSLCTKYGSLMIIDEVLTGFRIALGGAQERYDVKADITCFGKALGGGMPIGAYGASDEIMDRLKPDGDVYQAGTFSGNPVSMAGGVAMLDALKGSDAFRVLEQRSKRLMDGFEAIKAELEARQGRKLPVVFQSVGSMFAIMFAPGPVRNFEDSKKIDPALFARFFHEVLAQGIYLPPTAQDAACLSIAHSEEDIDRTLEASKKALESVFSA